MNLLSGGFWWNVAASLCAGGILMALTSTRLRGLLEGPDRRAIVLVLGFVAVLFAWRATSTLELWPPRDRDKVVRIATERLVEQSLQALEFERVDLLGELRGLRIGTATAYQLPEELLPSLRELLGLLQARILATPSLSKAEKELMLNRLAECRKALALAAAGMTPTGPSSPTELISSERGLD